MRCLLLTGSPFGQKTRAGGLRGTCANRLKLDSSHIYHFLNFSSPSQFVLFLLPSLPIPFPSLPSSDLPSLHLVFRFYLSVYALINILITIFALSRELYARLRSWHAGRTLFREMLKAVLYAPMSFFDTTPLGRIVNRFSKVIMLKDMIAWKCRVMV